MTTPKTIRVQKHVVTGRFEGPGISVGLTADYDNVEFLDIAITVPKSLKQRRREARERAVSESRRTYHLETVRVVNAIEQADAEFDREREEEVVEKLLGVVSRFITDPNYGTEAARSDIEAIYRGER